MKKKCLLSVALLLFYFGNLNAQTYEWAKNFGGASLSVQGKSIATDASANVYSTGYFQGTVDFDPNAGTANLTSAGGQDIFISKLAADGSYLWAKSIGGTAADNGLAITPDALGNIYVTGFFSGTADFDPGVGTANLTSSGNSDFFISKLDASGNYIWAKAFGGANADVGYAIALDVAGNVYSTGIFQLTVDFDPGAGTANLTSAGSQDIFVSKLDANGNYVWAKSIGGTNIDIGYGITVDAGGNIYTTGYFVGTGDFDPSAGTANLSSTGDKDIFISKLATDGSYLWAKSIGSTLGDISYGIAVDVSGNVFTTGYFNGTVDFDPGTGTANLTSSGSFDIFISKLDVSGNYVWAKAFGGATADVGYAIALDLAGNVYSTGVFQTTADFDPGAGTVNLTVAGNTDIFISKLAADGSYLWAKSIGGATTDYGYSIATDDLGNVVTTGYFQGTADFDPSAAIANLTSTGNIDIFISKLNQCTNLGALATGTDTKIIGLSGNKALVFASATCSVIGKVQPGTITGSTTAKVWIETTQPAQFVKRHYEITPATNANTATGTVTLYFTQVEFNDFNAVNTIKLPTGTADATGKANLRIQKRPGTSSDGSGLPGTYTGTAITINPNDANIVFNTAFSRWEVSFAVTGFSGFFVNTGFSILPLHLISFTGNYTNDANRLRWKTDNEKNTSQFFVERSSNGFSFLSISIVSANGNGAANYSYDDKDKLSGKIYYRLKIVDIDGKFTYSNIIALSNQQSSSLAVYPIPVKDKATLQITGNKLLYTKAQLTDISGKTVNTIFINNNFETIDMAQLPAGIYILRLNDGSVQKIVKE